MVATAVERIVVQTTLHDKEAIATKAKMLDMPVSELMRRAAFAYAPEASDPSLGALADAARDAADRCGLAIDDAMAFIAASNQRIARMEGAAAKPSKTTRSKAV